MSVKERVGSTLPGDSKYTVGGAVGLHGKIYFATRNSRKVTCIDPERHVEDQVVTYQTE